MPNPPAVEGFMTEHWSQGLIYKAGSGLVMGSLVGSFIGTLSGVVMARNAGLRGPTFLQNVGLLALQSAASFGFIMSVGAVVRG
jgi:hypothetical protein